MTLVAGDLVQGKYEVLSEIGRGAMGCVVEARHHELGHRCAIKTMAIEDSDTARERFLREGRAAAQINSEHVAKVHDVGSLPDGTPYMVMEFLDGRDLSAEIDARGPLDVCEAARYVRQACAGLRAAHSRDIVHRDIKPANLFLASQDAGEAIVKVIDFGVARKVAFTDQTLAQDLTGSGTLLGSPTYMAPEQLAASKTVDHRADIWALGVTLFELLTGEGAFEGETLAELSSAILRDPPQSARSLRKAVPFALERVIARCLCKDVDGRFQSAQELSEALAPFETVVTDTRHGEVGGAYRDSPQFRIIRREGGEQEPQSLKWVWAVVAVGLLGVAGLGLNAMKPGPPPPLLEGAFGSVATVRAPTSLPAVRDVATGARLELAKKHFEAKRWIEARAVAKEVALRLRGGGVTEQERPLLVEARLLEGNSFVEAALARIELTRAGEVSVLVSAANNALHKAKLPFSRAKRNDLDLAACASLSPARASLTLGKAILMATNDRSPKAYGLLSRMFNQAESSARLQKRNLSAGSLCATRADRIRAQAREKLDLLSKSRSRSKSKSKSKRKRKRRRKRSR